MLKNIKAEPVTTRIDSPEVIQLYYSFSEPKVKAREIRALLNAGTELDCPRLIVITSDYEKTETHFWFGKTAEIDFIPLLKWLIHPGRSI